MSELLIDSIVVLQVLLLSLLGMATLYMFLFSFCRVVL